MHVSEISDKPFSKSMSINYLILFGMNERVSNHVLSVVKPKKSIFAAISFIIELRAFLPAMSVSDALATLVRIAG